MSDLLQDSEIRSNIERAFTSDNELYPFDLNVTVGAGWVTLEGTVDAFWKKVRAEDLALGMRGVINLTNKIAVVPTQTIADERHPDYAALAEAGFGNSAGTPPGLTSKESAVSVAVIQPGIDAT